MFRTVSLGLCWCPASGPGSWASCELREPDRIRIDIMASSAIAVFGVLLFAKVKHGELLNADANFESFDLTVPGGDRYLCILDEKVRAPQDKCARKSDPHSSWRFRVTSLWHLS